MLIQSVSYIQNERRNTSMKAIRSIKYRMRETTSLIRCPNELLHEHDFIPAAKGSSTSLRCVTCGKYYCELCGKALADGLIFILGA
jgi:hypothetical protein